MFDYKNIIKLISKLIVNCLVLISWIICIGIVLTFLIFVTPMLSPNYIPCTGSAFNFLALGLFGLGGVFIMGIIAGFFEKSEEEKE